MSLLFFFHTRPWWLAVLANCRDGAWGSEESAHSASTILCSLSDSVTGMALFPASFAASLAAYYSSGRGTDKVEIDYIQKKHVKKPGGAKPGFVVYYTNYSMVTDSNIDDIQLIE